MSGGAMENGETAAAVMTTAGIYDMKARKPREIDEVVAALGRSPRAPAGALRIFMTSRGGVRALAKAGG